MRAVFFTPVMGNLNRSKGTNGTPSQAYTNSVLDQHSIYPGGQHTLAFYTKCVLPGGDVVSTRSESANETLEDKQKVVYALDCEECNINCVGKASKRLVRRMNEHKSAGRRHSFNSQTLAHMLKTGHVVEFMKDKGHAQVRSKAQDSYMRHGFQAQTTSLCLRSALWTRIRLGLKFVYLISLTWKCIMDLNGNCTISYQTNIIAYIMRTC